MDCKQPKPRIPLAVPVLSQINFKREPVLVPIPYHGQRMKLYILVQVPGTGTGIVIKKGEVMEPLQ